MHSQEGEAVIRHARPAEAGILSALALRSKGHWGYDASFLAASADDLALSPNDIATSAVYVHDAGDAIRGFYRLLLQEDGVAELDALFVQPTAMGQEVGKQLWQHAVARAAELRCTEVVLQSDPHAEGFYLAMGAQRAGVSQSRVFADRALPLLRFQLRHEEPRGSSS